MLEEVLVFTHFGPWGLCPLPLGARTDGSLISSLRAICVPSLAPVALVVLLLEEVLEVSDGGEEGEGGEGEGEGEEGGEN